MKTSLRFFLSLAAISSAGLARAEYPVDAHTVALWRFDGRDGLAFPDAGPNALDLSGGTSLSLAASPEDSALVLEGQTGLILPDSTRISVGRTGMLTYQARIWLDAYPPAANHNRFGFVMGKYEGMGLFIRSDGRLQVNNQKGNGSSWMWYAPTTAPGAVPLKRWVEVAAACDQAAAECYVYVDGAAQATYTYMVGETYAPLPAYSGNRFRSAASPLTVGYNAGDGQYLAGRIEAVRISDTLVYAPGPGAVTTPPPADPVSGAIARWDFNEGAGDTVHDRTGNGHHGIIDRARWADGVKGTGLFFDGLSTVIVPADSQLNPKSVTLSLWLYQSGNGKRGPLVTWQNHGGLINTALFMNTRGWAEDLPGAIYVNMRPLGFSASDPSDVRERNSTPTEPGVTQGGRWNHILFTYDNSVRRLRIYANGKLCMERMLAPFTPTMAGHMFIGRSSPTSIEWDAGLGLVGTIDEMALYGRALTDAEVQTLYGRPPVEAQSLHLGMKTHHAEAGDTVVVPVYLTSDGKDSLSSLQFKLALDTTVARLLDVDMGDDTASDWEVTGWNAISADTIAVALAGTKRLVGALEGELLRFKLKVDPGAKQGASTLLTLADIVVDEGRQAKLTHTPGRILVLATGIKYGDVNGDGAVDRTDAGLILQHVIGKLPLPSADFPAFTVAVTDVSGNDAITAFDAALVLQFGLGIIEDFPVQSVPLLAKRSAAGRIAISAATRVEGNVWRFRIQGEGLGGLIGGELNFEGLGPIASIVRVASPVAGIRATYSFDPGTRRLGIALAGNRRLAAAAVELLEVDVVYPENSSARGLLLSDASFNEGSLHFDVVTDPVSVTPAQASRAAALRLSWDGAGLRFEVPGHSLATVEVLDIRGRRVATQRHAQPVAAGHLSRSALPAGALILRVSGADGTWTQILPSIVP